jgi:outer membrane protein TolC
MPDLNFQVNYSSTAAGGRELIRGGGFGGDIIGTVDTGFGNVLGSVFNSEYPTWTFALTMSYPLGTSNADANLARSRLQRSQTEARIRLSELQAAAEVRRAGRNVNTNLKRVDATRAARQLAEERLEAEQKKFAVGMSTSFLVFQAQRDLADARNSELRAVLDYNKALVDFEASQETSLTGGGGSFTVTTGGGGGGFQGGGGQGGGGLLGGQGGGQFGGGGQPF